MIANIEKFEKSVSSKKSGWHKQSKLRIENPIIDNRIVSDKTFARRLISHLKSTTSNCQMGEEETDYLLYVAEKLLKYQIDTCPEDEKWYHLNCDRNCVFSSTEP